MAIVRMKKLRLMAARAEKDSLLRELERFGCVEVSELDSSLADAGLIRENGDAIGLKNLQNTLMHAISLLDRYSPEKKPLLSPKPQVELSELLDDTRLSQAESEAEVINGLEEKMKRLTTEENRQNGLLESLQPWMDLDLPLDTAATERSAVLWGSIPARVALEDVTAAVEQASDEAELFQISMDKSSRAVLVVCIREAVPAVQECLRPFGFTAISFPGEHGTAKESSSAAQERLKFLPAKKRLSGRKLSIRRRSVRS